MCRSSLHLGHRCCSERAYGHTCRPQAPKTRVIIVSRAIRIFLEMVFFCTFQNYDVDAVSKKAGTEAMSRLHAAASATHSGTGTRVYGARFNIACGHVPAFYAAAEFLPKAALPMTVSHLFCPLILIPAASAGVLPPRPRWGRK